MNPNNGPKIAAGPAALKNRSGFLCGLHQLIMTCPKEAMSSVDREQLIKEKDEEISSLKTALAEKKAEAQELKECLDHMEVIKSLKLADQAKEYYSYCGRLDNHLKISRTTSVYDPKDGPKARYDKDYVSGHHTNSNPSAG